MQKIVRCYMDSGTYMDQRRTCSNTENPVCTFLGSIVFQLVFLPWSPILCLTFQTIQLGAFHHMMLLHVG